MDTIAVLFSFEFHDNKDRMVNNNEKYIIFNKYGRFT